MKKLLLIGCGNIGSRHLQGIAKLSSPIHVDIVEPNIDSQNLGKTRLNEINFDSSDHSFSWYDSINEVNVDNDLTIIATTAEKRAELIIQILEKGATRLLIEKLVCQSSKQYDSIISAMNRHNAKGWVNTNRRYFDSYQKIKNDFSDEKTMYFSVISGQGGLGRDSIHYLDLFSWLDNNSKLKLQGDSLFNEIYPNKRGKEFVEFGGTITGISEKKSTLSISFFPDWNLFPIINLINENQHIVIDESKGIITYFKNDGKNQIHDFRYEYVSDLTTKIASDIIEKDQSTLPTVIDSSYVHKELFRIFCSQIKKIKNEEVELCPIT